MLEWNFWIFSYLFIDLYIRQEDTGMANILQYS
jgi:hypothetical protein